MGGERCPSEKSQRFTMVPMQRRKRRVVGRWFSGFPILLTVESISQVRSIFQSTAT